MLERVLEALLDRAVGSPSAPRRVVGQSARPARPAGVGLAQPAAAGPRRACLVIADRPAPPRPRGEANCKLFPVNLLLLWRLGSGRSHGVAV